jgi:hypothetical protein
VSTSSLPTSITVPNVLYRYYDLVQRGLESVEQSRASSGTDAAFDPGYRLPPRSDNLERLFEPSRMTLAPLGLYRGRRLCLLDLMGNPRTRTTKTFASLVIVARLVRHVRETGEPGLIVTPSSGNKATALRDAVLRAVEAGLVRPDQVQIAVVVPGTSLGKLWSSPMVTTPDLRDRNPVAVYSGPERDGVKAVTRDAVDACAPRLRQAAGRNVWYTLDIDNYLAGDVVRAAVEQDVMPPAPNGRLHVHAVSSAYGLLGHDFGCRLLARTGGWHGASRYFLVQHLETPDMVLSLLFDGTSRDNLPAYRRQDGNGLHVQTADPHFPAATVDVEECLDPTFYTRRPPTSAQMNALIREQGGGGIVVSRHECVERYAEIGALLARGGVDLPEDPDRLREWSLVMAMTGIVNAIDRGLVEDDDILVHGSGSYADGDFEPIPAGHVRPVAGAADLSEVIATAVLGPGHAV